MRRILVIWLPMWKWMRRRLAQDLAALQAENRKEEIDRMQAGTEKKLAQIEYDYNARKEEINRQEADWKRDNKEAGLSSFTSGVQMGLKRPGRVLFSAVWPFYGWVDGFCYMMV